MFKIYQHKKGTESGEKYGADFIDLAIKLMGEFS